MKALSPSGTWSFDTENEQRKADWWSFGAVTKLPSQGAARMKVQLIRPVYSELIKEKRNWLHTIIYLAVPSRIMMLFLIYSNDLSPWILAIKTDNSGDPQLILYRTSKRQKFTQITAKWPHLTYI